MTVLKPNILSWAWAVLVLLNPVEVEVFSLAKALPIKAGYVDCCLQIKAMQTIPWKPQLWHSLTTGNVCQVTQVSVPPVWFHSYFTPGLWFPDYPYCSCAAFGSNNFGQLFLSKRKCWHSWQTSQLQADHTGCVPPRLELLLYATVIQHSPRKPSSLSSPLQTLRPCRTCDTPSCPQVRKHSPSRQKSCYWYLGIYVTSPDKL